MRVDMFTNKILVNTEFESVSLQHKYSVIIVNKAMYPLSRKFYQAHIHRHIVNGVCQLFSWISDSHEMTTTLLIS